VKREGASASLHELLERALDRAARAQAHSDDLVARQEALTGALHETIADIRRRRHERATFGNGHSGARDRSRPG
jgi:hypothetical protein